MHNHSGNPLLSSELQQSLNEKVTGLKKQYRDIHVKMGYKKLDSSKESHPSINMGQTYVPNDLTPNHWGEINEYYAGKYRAEQERLKEDKKQTMIKIKRTLDNQIMEQRQERDKLRQQMEQIDVEYLDRAKRLIKQEEEQREERARQARMQKKEQDSMLREVQKEKLARQERERSKEILEVGVLRDELEQEKIALTRKRISQQEEAKAIHMFNEAERMKMKAQQAREREEAVKLIELNNRLQDQQDKKRA